MWRIVGGVLLLMLTCQVPLAQESPDSPASKEEMDAYCHGYLLGKRIYFQDKGIALERLQEGLTDGFKGEPKYVDEERIKSQDKGYRQLRKQVKFHEKKTQLETNRATEKNFLEGNSSKEGVVTLSSGLQYRIIKKGSGGLPRLANRVVVRYKGTFPDGTVFDSSLEEKEPRSFKIQNTIKGWREALKLMPEGSHWEIFVPAKLGYGKKGKPPFIQPNQMLIFELELIKIIKPENKKEE